LDRSEISAAPKLAGGDSFPAENTAADFNRSDIPKAEDLAFVIDAARDEIVLRPLPPTTAPPILSFARSPKTSIFPEPGPDPPTREPAMTIEPTWPRA
jgi:hypothetical protein